MLTDSVTKVLLSTLMEQGTFRHVTDSSRSKKLSLSLVMLKPVSMGFQTLMSAYNLLTILLKKGRWPFKFLDMTFRR